jgi:predicted PurR-regulated permease PerM
MSNNSVNTQGWTAGRIVLATLVVVVMVAGFWALHHFRLALVLLFTALVLATSLQPFIERLRRLRLPPMMAAILVHLAVFALLAAFLVWMAPLIVQQTIAFVEAIPALYADLRAEMLASSNRFVERLASEMPGDLRLLVEAEPSQEPLGGVAAVWDYFRSLLWGLFLVLATFLLSVYWSNEGERILRSLLFLVPLEQRETARELVGQIQNKLGAFVIGQSILCVAVGLMALVAYWLIGLPYALSLAFIAGVFEAIPNIGPILGAIPAVFVGLTVGPDVVLWVIAANVVISLLENYLLVPRVMDESVGVHPVVTLVAITALVAAVGVLGGVLAIPLAAVAQVLLRRFVFEATPVATAGEASRDHLGVLKYQAQELLDDLRSQWRETPATPESPLADHAEQTIEGVVLELNRALDWAVEQRRKP